MLIACVGLTVGVGACATARAHQGQADTPAKTRVLPPEQKPWGIAGNPKKVTRTIEIRMTDDMRFTPARITVRQGETVRLHAVNRGRMLHEIVLGTSETIEAHAEMMRMHPRMEHDDPWMAHVPMGRSGDVVWQFNRPGRFEFACLVEDHYELGMSGRIDVTPRAR